jgi:hypothetical protein
MAASHNDAFTEKGAIVDGNGNGISPSDSTENHAVAPANDLEAPSRDVSTKRQSVSDVFTIVSIA